MIPLVTQAFGTWIRTMPGLCRKKQVFSETKDPEILFRIVWLSVNCQYSDQTIRYTVEIQLSF